VLVTIILLGIISIVWIARTSGKTDSGPPTTMMSCSVLSWARGRLTWPLTWSRGLRSQGSSRNVPRFPIVEQWRDGTQSEWLLFYLQINLLRLLCSQPLFLGCQRDSWAPDASKRMTATNLPAVVDRWHRYCFCWSMGPWHTPCSAYYAGNVNETL